MPKKKSRKPPSRKHLPKEGPPLALPEGDPRDIQSTQLLLDPQNLRLLEASSGLLETPAELIAQTSVQERIYTIMANNPLFDIDALVKSIEYNGFLKHEQLIVAPFDGEKYLVLEGNRRVSAVRKIFEKHGLDLGRLSQPIKQSLQTLPCFVLRGSAIAGNQQRLLEYRRASEIYIGIRHLMGAKGWEPASRYEFQWRLVHEGWTVEQVAERFGRDVPEVQRDLRAQTLYRDFRAFEKDKNIGHAITYNAFAEAARATSTIMKWLEWSSDAQRVENKEHEETFFCYLILKLKRPPQSPGSEEEVTAPKESAELVVRKLRDMLKRDDEDIIAALEERQFDLAELLFEERKERTFAKRILSYTRGLKRTTIGELTGDPVTNKKLLQDLQAQAAKLIKLIGGSG